MNRRAFLAASITGATAGCLGDNDQTEFRLRFIELVNGAPTPWPVSVVITQNGTRQFDRSKTIPRAEDNTAGSWRITEPWMTQKAAYRVTVESDATETVEPSTQSVADSFDLDPETSCLQWTVLRRDDGSVGVFPDPGCSGNTVGSPTSG